MPREILKSESPWVHLLTPIKIISDISAIQVVFVQNNSPRIRNHLTSWAQLVVIHVDCKVILRTRLRSTSTVIQVTHGIGDFANNLRVLTVFLNDSRVYSSLIRSHRLAKAIVRTIRRSSTIYSVTWCSLCCHPPRLLVIILYACLSYWSRVPAYQRHQRPSQVSVTGDVLMSGCVKTLTGAWWWVGSSGRKEKKKNMFIVSCEWETRRGEAIHWQMHQLIRSHATHVHLCLSPGSLHSSIACWQENLMNA